MRPDLDWKFLTTTVIALAANGWWLAPVPGIEGNQFGLFPQAA